MQFLAPSVCLYDVHAVADIVSDRCNLKVFILKHETDKYFHLSYILHERLIYPMVYFYLYYMR